MTSISLQLQFWGDPHCGFLVPPRVVSVKLTMVWIERSWEVLKLLHIASPRCFTSLTFENLAIYFSFYSQSGDWPWCRSNGWNLVGDICDTWPNQMAIHVMVYLTPNIYESHKLEWHMAPILWFYVTLGDVDRLHHSSLEHFNNILVHQDVESPRIGLLQSVLHYPFTHQLDDRERSWRIHRFTVHIDSLLWNSGVLALWHLHYPKEVNVGLTMT